MEIGQIPPSHGKDHALHSSFPFRDVYVIDFVFQFADMQICRRAHAYR